MAKTMLLLLVYSTMLAAVEGGGVCYTRVDVRGVPEDQPHATADEEDGGSIKDFDPTNGGLVAISAGANKASEGDVCNEPPSGVLTDWYHPCKEKPEDSLPAHAADAKGAKCCIAQPLCNAKPAKDAKFDNKELYHVGICRKADGSNTKGGESFIDGVTYKGPGGDVTKKADADCGIVQVINFPDGKMILEYEPGEEPCGGGMFIPFFPGQFIWGITGHTIIFLCAMIFSFLGVAIIADVFMAAIEVITSASKTTQIPMPDGTTKTVEFKVWNETVANLTLMALGSSAPEILLSVIETLGLTNAEPTPGGLGPGTIVGSAAFNLLVIIAICVMAIPKPEGDETGFRKIKQMGVFNCTAFFSVFAYIWLFICVADNNVTIIEAFVTFLFFPLLVILSYWLDKRASRKEKAVVPDDIDGGTNQYVVGTSGMGAKGYGTKEDLAKKLATLKASQGIAGLLAEKEANVDKKELAAQKKKVAALAVSEIQSEAKVSVMQAKINARRGISGGRRVVAGAGDQEALEELKKIASAKKAQDRAEAEKRTGTDVTLIGFDSAHYAVDEGKGKVQVKVVRGGKTDSEVCVYYTTIDGDAIAGSDYKFTRGSVTFKKNETEKTIEVELIDDSDYEPDESFYIELTTPKQGKKGTPTEPWEFHAAFGPSMTTVTILNDDNPGTISFEKPAYSVSEANGKVKMKIVRTDGTSGAIEIRVQTQDGTAKSSADYVKFDQVVTMADSQCEKEVLIELVADDDNYEKEENFTVELTPVSEGLVRGDHMRSVVTIVSDEGYAKLIEEVAELMALQFENLSLESATWADQFDEAMNLQGEEGESPGTMDYVMHFLTFGWKVIFATVPPTSMNGGWLTFFVALGYIGVLTAFIADIAGIFGCLLGLDDAITAITFVALGTSLPDTFASKTAAVNDDTADASVGNVTGSNSVNVFLGLGLPWVLATVINTAAGFKSSKTDGNEGDYPMIAGDLGFSVVIFCICACTCLGTLYVRRFVFGYELGGQAKGVTGAFFLGLWLIYVAVSSLQITGTIESFM